MYIHLVIIRLYCHCTTEIPTKEETYLSWRREESSESVLLITDKAVVAVAVLLARREQQQLLLSPLSAIEFFPLVHVKIVILSLLLNKETRREEVGRREEEVCEKSV